MTESNRPSDLARRNESVGLAAGVVQLASPIARIDARIGDPATSMQEAMVIAEGGHFVPRPIFIRETLDWLDRYLGPIK